jgi:hypothetical protein
MDRLPKVEQTFMKEIPLMHHREYPGLLLKARVIAIQNTQVGKPTILKICEDAAIVYEAFKRHGRMESLDQAILLLQIAMKLVPPPGAESLILNQLGSWLRDRFERLGNLSDITGSIERLQAAVNFTSDDNHSKPGYLNSLGSSFMMRFERFNRADDLNSAILSRKTAVNLMSSGNPQKPGLSSNLGASLQVRFEKFGETVDLDDAILSYQTAVDLTSDDSPSKITSLNDLGQCLVNRFTRFGNIIDLDSAIQSLQTAVNLNTGVSLIKMETKLGVQSELLDQLGSWLRRRFEQLGNLPDINESIERLQAAVNLISNDHLNKPGYLSNLGNSFVRRFERLGKVDDLDNAILSNKTAVDLMFDGHPGKSALLHNLGGSLQVRFDRFGNTADLNNTILSYQAAIDLTPDSHPGKASSLSNLGTSLINRFDRLGNIVDLDNAIQSLQAAVDFTLDSDPNKPACLSNLGVSLEIRFERLDNITDLTNAILAHQAAVNLIPDGHPYKPGRLNNLGSSLANRFKRLGNVEDLDNAILSVQAAVNLTPDGHPEKRRLLSNLGSSFETRFRQSGSIADLDNAILTKQTSLDLTPESHPEKPVCLSNLGNSLITRFKQLKNTVDLENALSSTQAAVNLTPDDHHGKSSYLINLGSAFETRFYHIQDSSDAESAISHFSTAAKSPFGPPTTRFSAVERWISVASIISHQSLLSAYECALEIMPLLAWLGLPIPDRHRHLAQIGGITREAVATAIAAEQYEKALEWLEQGRSIVWTQILQLRTPVDELRAIRPELADSLMRVSQLLDRGPQPKDRMIGELQAPEDEGERYRALTIEWESIIKQARSLPNFENFLRPPNSLKLMKAAQDGPIIVLNIAKERCDALALVPGLEEIVQIPLPDITSKRITELRDELKDMLYTNGIRLRAAMRVPEGNDEEDCRHILAELWNGIVKPVLDSLAFFVRVIPRP